MSSRRLTASSAPTVPFKPGGIKRATPSRPPSVPLEGGVYQKPPPNTPLAGAIYATVQNALAEYRVSEQRELGMTKTRDADVLGLLVFLQYFALDRDNGRRRGRAFLGALREFHPPAPEASGSSPS